MYIPRPAKLLFQHDDGWSRYLDKHGDYLTDWTKLAVERMLGLCRIKASSGNMLFFNIPHL
ncbi:MULTISPECIES: hypothetical protein [Serratia]|uniref:hypothetical protein n=1 Tax=Serratia marcescens TaxID=615 RepID=UPI00094A29FA|nr:hypothetical protein [Serratia marcescens]APS37038.1 hypothetical protein RN42_25870 [Serratia marcescens]